LTTSTEPRRVLLPARLHFLFVQVANLRPTGLGDRLSRLARESAAVLGACRSPETSETLATGFSRLFEGAICLRWLFFYEPR